MPTFGILTVVSFGLKPVVSGGLAAGSSFRADAGFEVEPDVLTGLSSSVRCSKSRVMKSSKKFKIHCY